MKSVRRQQKDIDKARARLIGWANGSQEGANGITRTLYQGTSQTRVVHWSAPAPAIG